MNAIYNKMKYKQQDNILILNMPDDVREIMEDFPKRIDENIKAKYEFIILFARNRMEADIMISQAIDATQNDSQLWFCYPKGTSKNYKSDIKRNVVWDLFKPYGYRPVSQISINEDWSSIRLRNEKYVSSR